MTAPPRAPRCCAPKGPQAHRAPACLPHHACPPPPQAATPQVGVQNIAHLYATMISEKTFPSCCSMSCPMHLRSCRCLTLTLIVLRPSPVAQDSLEPVAQEVLGRHTN